MQEESPDLFSVGLKELDSQVHSTGSDQGLVQSIDVVCRENKNLSVPVGYPVQSIQEATEGQRAFFGLLVSVGVEKGVDIFDDNNGVLWGSLKTELNRVVVEVRIRRLEEAEVASEMPGKDSDEAGLSRTRWAVEEVGPLVAYSMISIPFRSFGRVEGVDVLQDLVLQDLGQDHTVDRPDQLRCDVLPMAAFRIPLVDSVDLVDGSLVPFDQGVAEILEEFSAARVLIDKEDDGSEFLWAGNGLADNLMKDSDPMALVVELVQADSEGQSVPVLPDVLDRLLRVEEIWLVVGQNPEAVEGVLLRLSVDDVPHQNGIESLFW